MKKLLIFVAMILCIALAGSVLAAKEVKMTRLDDAVVENLATSRGDCVVGNMNPTAYAITDWVWGLEGYKYLFDPSQGCGATCVNGLTVTDVHMLLNFGPEDVPSTFSAYVDVEESVWDDLLGCWFPGPEICVSDVVEFTVTEAGLYDFTIPVVCDCMEFGYQYLLSFHITTEFPEAGRPDIITDEFPVGCTSWNDYGFGWQDMQGFDLPGEIIMWADANCCENPVATETETWGSIKSLYR